MYPQECHHNDHHVGALFICCLIMAHGTQDTIVHLTVCVQALETAQIYILTFVENYTV